MSKEQSRIGVLVALREEWRAVEPGLRRLGVTLGRLGMGRDSAFAKGSTFFDRVQPGVVLVCGFGGGLKPGLSTGDVVVASEVIEDAVGGQSWRAPTSLLAIAEGAARNARLTRGSVSVGRLGSVPRVLGSARAKREAWARLGVDVVDMESSGVLDAAASRGIAVLCVRAVLDDESFELPFDFGRILTPDGRPRVLEAAGAVAANPAGLAKLLSLRERAQAAARSLGEIVPALVEALQ